MRKVVAYELLSLDGVAEHPDQFITEFDALMEEDLGRVIATQDSVLLGRRTYNDWAEYWPTSDLQPFANFINKVEKFVATSSALDRQWEGTTPLHNGLTDFVVALKQRTGRDIGVHGSISLTQTLLEADLVDELRLVIAPALQREGRRLFDVGLPKRMSLTRSATSPSGYLMVDYSLGS